MALLARQTPERGMGVGEVAAAIGKSIPYASQSLRKMEARGQVSSRATAIPTGRTVQYTLAPWGEMLWSSASEGVVVHWRARSEIDWQFPLVSQIPDLDGQATTLNVLDQLEKEGALRARHRPGTAVFKRRKDDFLGLTLIVHGSTARGTARKGSDLDLVVFHQDRRPDIQERIHARIDEASLHSPRPVQLAMFHWGGDLEQVPDTLRHSIRESGLIVFDGLRERAHGQTLGFWRIVYGGRRHDLE